MEEILASIRKIIAEEPVGSRATSPPQQQRPQPAASPYASFMGDRAPRESALRVESLTTSPAQPFEPPIASKASSFQSHSFPSFESLSEPRVQPSPAKPAQAAADSVQAQLSDLLGGAELAAGKASAAQDRKKADSVALPSATAPEAVRETSAEAEPRFTVSRDGYMPDAQSGPRASPMPFDFDLGPSPFSKRKPDAPAEARPQQPAISDAALDDVLAAFEAPSSKPAKAGPPTPASAEARPKPAAAAAPVAPSVPPSGPAPSVAQKPVTETQPAPKPAVAVQPKPVEPKTVTPLAQPSISATLPPNGEASRGDLPGKPAADKLAKSVDILTSRAGRESIQDVVTEAVSAAMPRQPKFSAIDVGGAPVAVELDDGLSTAMARYGSTPNVPAVRDGEMGIRTMEDTVADLLRPMLKSWLAENMPKIIERALRREISEMNLTSHVSEHKTAAE